jgi:hypothetical protein
MDEVLYEVDEQLKYDICYLFISLLYRPLRKEEQALSNVYQNHPELSTC